MTANIGAYAAQAVEAAIVAGEELIKAEAIQIAQKGEEILESNIKKRMHEAEDKIYEWGHGKYVKFHKWKQRKIRRTNAREDIIIPATPTHPMVTEAPIEELKDNIVDAMDIQQANITSIGSLRKSTGSYNMAYPYRRRRRRRRRRRKKKYATKRGVKQMMAKYGNVLASGIRYEAQLKQYMGDHSGGIPTPTYGQVVRGELGFYDNSSNESHVGKGYLQTYFDNFTQLAPLTGGAQQPQTDQVQYRVTKARVKMWLHSCMNEDVHANFWLLRTLDNHSNNPTSRWQTAYESLGPATGDVAFANNFMTYPTRYKEFTRTFKIVKKWKAKFSPGATRTLNFSLPGFTWNDAEDNEIAHTAGQTMFLMYELKGVPTHQNDGGDPGTQTFNINYTPAALDCVYHVTLKGAVSSSNYKTTNSRSQLQTVTAAVSQIPENKTLINTV